MNTYSVEFLFDFNDLGIIPAEVVCDVWEPSRGSLDFKVTSVNIESSLLKIDEKHLISLLSDSTRAMHSDLEDQLTTLWVSDKGWVA